MQDQKPRLTRLADFKNILKNYHPSDDAITTLRSTRTAYIIGPTGSGKNTLIKELLKTGEYYNVLSDTTRPRRMEGDRLEYDGEFYWHISEDDFLKGLGEGRYIEAAIIHNQQVSGSSIEEYAKAQELGKIAITDVEAIYGVQSIHLLYPEAHYIFILPPDFEAWMERLNARGKMTEHEISNRLKSAQQEITLALDRDYYEYIISGDLAVNVNAVHEFLQDKVPLEIDQPQAIAHAKELLTEIQASLDRMTV